MDKDLDGKRVEELEGKECEMPGAVEEAGGASDEARLQVRVHRRISGRSRRIIMGFFGDLDKAMHKDLVEFAENCEKKKQARLGEYILATILKNYIDGKCGITGYMKSDKKVWMEITWDFSKKDEINPPVGSNEEEGRKDGKV